MLAESMQDTLSNTVVYINRVEAAWQIKYDNVDDHVTRAMTKISLGCC